MEISIERYQESWRMLVLEVWEQSVRATHHFLLLSDIDFYKSLVQEIDFTSFEVFCAFTADGKMVGFLGTSNQKLEMLFLPPNAMGKGIGTRLMKFILEDLKVSQVDVNEQNLQAITYYKKFGFQVYDRSALDDSGKPYPILKMRLDPAEGEFLD